MTTLAILLCLLSCTHSIGCTECVCPHTSGYHQDCYRSTTRLFLSYLMSSNRRKPGQPEYALSTRYKAFLTNSKSTQCTCVSPGNSQTTNGPSHGTGEPNPPCVRLESKAQESEIITMLSLSELHSSNYRNCYYL